MAAIGGGIFLLVMLPALGGFETAQLENAVRAKGRKPGPSTAVA